MCSNIFLNAWSVKSSIIGSWHYLNYGPTGFCQLYVRGYLCPIIVCFSTPHMLETRYIFIDMTLKFLKPLIIFLNDGLALHKWENEPDLFISLDISLFKDCVSMYHHVMFLSRFIYFGFCSIWDYWLKVPIKYNPSSIMRNTFLAIIEDATQTVPLTSTWIISV